MGKSNENEERKDLTALLLERKRIMRNLVLLLAAFVVVLLGIFTMAWFANNTNTKGSGMNVSVNDLPFELKVQGYYGYFDDRLPNAYYKIANSLSAAPTPTTDPASTLTTGGHASIQWLMTDSYNAKNYVVSTTKDEDKGIRPGSHGELKFWVVPKGEGTVDIRFIMHLTPYAVTYQTANGSYVLDANGNLIEESITSVEENNSYTEVIDYLKSHILFFKKYENGKYSDLIALDQDFALVYDSTSSSYVTELTFTVENEALQDKPFSIYWIWPETLTEAVLPPSMQKSGVNAICAEGNLEVFNLLAANPEKWLKGYTSNDVDNNTLTQNVVYRYYKKLGVEYNEADQDIGDNIGYLLLELTAGGL